MSSVWNRCQSIREEGESHKGRLFFTVFSHIRLNSRTFPASNLSAALELDAACQRRRRHGQVDMRRTASGAILGLLITTAAYGQDRGVYIKADAGFVASPEATSRDIHAEIGTRVTDVVQIFGQFGRLANVQPSSAQPGVDSAIAALQGNGYSVIGSARGPAWFSVGGIRAVARSGAVRPYAMASLGFAHLSPTAQFTYQAGPTLSGAAFTAGQDATADVFSNKYFNKPLGITALMCRVGGGIQIPINKLISADVAYSVSRISSTTPITAKGLDFGIAFRF